MDPNTGKKEMFNNRVREVLSYVPSAIFPAIIFPAIFLDDLGMFNFPFKIIEINTGLPGLTLLYK